MEDEWKGYCIDLIEKLSIEMNFKYELVIKDQFGELDPVTNQWNGLIGGLVDGVSERAFINIIYCIGTLLLTFELSYHRVISAGTGYCYSCTHHDIGTRRSYRFHCSLL